MTSDIVFVQALFLGRAQDITDTGSAQWWDKPWQTGFFKQLQTEPCWLGYGGFLGDQQADRANHGGVDKAVCVYPIEHYAEWRGTLRLPEVPHGAFGENLTTHGLIESSVCIGDVFTVGEARVQISQPRQPCWKLARRWRIKDLSAQVERTGRTGFYFRVLRHGTVAAGDAITLVERTCAEWTIERCNEVMHHEKDDLAAARALAGCPLLSGSWKDSLWARASRAATASSASRLDPP